jgi:deoxycytidylate deaminase
MKGGQNLRELQEKAKLEVRLTPCLVCGKRITDGFYGRWHVEEHVNSGTCSKTCNTLYTEKRNALYQVQDGHQAQ